MAIFAKWVIRVDAREIREIIEEKPYTYHLRQSRDHVSRSIGRIRQPRHFLLFRITAESCLEIGRVLHDSLDLARHLPLDYPSSAPGLDE
ncbi:MAG: hypothetical protein ACKOBW_05935 [Planctomycetota bacterium]